MPELIKWEAKHSLEIPLMLKIPISGVPRTPASPCGSGQCSIQQVLVSCVEHSKLNETGSNETIDPLVICLLCIDHMRKRVSDSLTIRSCEVSR